MEKEAPMKNPLVILAGPTAVGKTALSIALAKALGGEIISADSMQVYKYMDIGTAKIMPDEMEGIPHYLIDELEPDAPFNVVIFQKKAKEHLRDIHRRGKIPLLVGGTGFYIQAVLYDVDFTETEENTPLRETLLALARERGNEYLHDRLREADPQSAREIHPNNVKRVIRALEYFQETGEPISRHNERERQKTSPYQACYFVLTDRRERLYQQIERRVEDMMAKGLAEEVRTLRERGYGRELPSMQGLGYKELFPWLEGDCSLEEAVAVLKRDTRHFAKRQLTWFRREPDVVWVSKEEFGYDEEAILAFMMDCLKQKGII